MQQTEREGMLSPEDLEGLGVGETTLRAVERARPRDSVQQYFDNLVTDAYNRWLEAGKPSDRRARPALRVDCGTEDLAREVYNKLRASAVHLNVGISIDPVARIAENKWRVAFSAQDKRKRSSKAS
jgi:hypothetical protein